MNHWQRRTLHSYSLYPLSLLYRGVVGLRAALYRRGLLKSAALSVPVVVVGNLTVGGAGKTPLVLALTDLLREAGNKPGIITRGYKGSSSTWPRIVNKDTTAAEVGDEALLLARRSGCPVVAGPDRAADGRLLLREFDCDLILSDDGFQHFALERDLDIVVIDGARRFGNGFCLPAGPLREPIKGLRRADLRVANGAAQTGEYWMRLRLDRAVRLDDASVSMPLERFRGRSVHAVAGIGHPDRFFLQLEEKGIEIIPHPFPDHHAFTASDLRFDDSLPVLMTEKDAVKCENLVVEDRYWVVPAAVELQPELKSILISKLV
ncbi:MAG: tetraacyldisaccharide 4'-kinase [Pseudomonadota bacterium]|nr:tetraacyldisaccharide 4'-kinase [Pseudomonadota bacterium]